MRRWLVTALLVAGCGAAEPGTGVKQEIFEPLYRASRAIQAAVESGDVTLVQFRDLVQTYRAELAVASDSTPTSDAGHRLLELHETALEMYSNAAATWADSLTSELINDDAVRAMLSPGNAFVDMATNVYFGREESEGID